MSKLRILSLALGASVCLAAAGHAAPVSLNVQNGLWNMTTAGTTSGTPTIPAAQLAKLSPAQRAQVAAMMAAALATADKPITYQSCVTPESLQHGFKDPELSGGCTETVVSSTATEMNVKIVCTGSHHMTGSFHVQASSPQAISATAEMTVTDGGGAMKVNRQITGKWVSADCGDVKP